MFALLARARELSRRIYASLPWGYRVAGVFLHIASSLTDTLGKVVYAEFIKAGVEGMPPINGAPPDPAAYSRAERLPSGYGKRFAERTYALLLGKARKPDLVEDILSQLMMNIARGKLQGLKPNSSLRDAEQYVMTMAMNLLREFWRSRDGKPSNNQELNEETLDIADPRAFQQLDKLLPHHELANLMKDLERVHERAPSWLEAKLDGLTGVEIAAEWGMGKSGVSGWESRYVPEIKKVLYRYIQDAAA